MAKLVIIVSGVPGTGKTVLARKIAEQINAKYVDVNQLVKEKKIKAGFSKKYSAFVVDVDKLNKFLLKIIKESKEDLVFDSHLTHYLPASKVDFCFITKCELGTLKRRLEERGYSIEKIRENLDAEIFDVCLVEALENGHKPIIIDTTKGLKGFKFSEHK